MQKAKRKRSGEAAEDPGSKKAKTDPKPDIFVVVTDPKAPAVMGLPNNLHPTMERLADNSRIYYCQAEGCDFNCSGGDSCAVHVRKVHTKQQILCYLCGHATWSARMAKEHHKTEHGREEPIVAPEEFIIPPVAPPQLEGEAGEGFEVKREVVGAELKEVEKAVEEEAGE
jgi:hypothetical protein